MVYISVFFLLCSLPILCSGNLSSCSANQCYHCRGNDLNCSLILVDEVQKIYNYLCILPSECTRQTVPQGFYFCLNHIHIASEEIFSVAGSFFAFSNRDCSDVQPNCLNLYIEVPTIESFYDGHSTIQCLCYEDNCQMYNNITVAVIGDDKEPSQTHEVIEAATSLIPTHSGPDYGTSFINNDISLSSHLIILMSTTPGLSQSSLLSTTSLPSPAALSTTTTSPSSIPSSLSSHLIILMSTTPGLSQSSLLSTTSLPSPAALSTTTTSPSSIPSSPSPSTAILITVVVLAFVLLLAIIIVVSLIIVLFYYHNRYKRGRHSHQIDLRGSPPTSPLPPDPEIFPLSFLQMIGQGKFGTVWKAIYNKETVAVKIFDIHHKSSWQNEKHINSLDSTPHQDILPFIDSLTRETGYNSQFFIITQYFPLGSLNQFLCHNTLSFEQAWNMMYSVSSGLTHLHSTSYSNSEGLILEKYAVVHRDVKTSNVLVKDECGHCVLGDLGLALILDPSFDDHQLANSGQVGTYRYMAPEALDARVNLRDIESFKQIDAYALTYVLWEVCTRLKIEGNPVQPYHPPLYDVIGERATLDQIKEAVVISKCRPTIPGLWYSDKRLQKIVSLMEEGWDEDPEARLTVANITTQLECLVASKCNNEEDTVSTLKQEISPSVLEMSQSSMCKKIRTSTSFSGSSSIQPSVTPLRYSVDNTHLPLSTFQELQSNHEEMIALSRITSPNSTDSLTLESAIETTTNHQSNTEM